VIIKKKTKKRVLNRKNERVRLRMNRDGEVIGASYRKNGKAIRMIIRSRLVRGLVTNYFFVENNKTFLRVRTEISKCQSRCFCIDSYKQTVRAKGVNRQMIVDYNFAGTKKIPKNHVLVILKNNNKISKRFLNLKTKSSKKYREFDLLSNLPDEVYRKIIPFGASLKPVIRRYEKQIRTSRLNLTTPLGVRIYDTPFSIIGFLCRLTCDFMFVAQVAVCHMNGAPNPISLFFCLRNAHWTWKTCYGLCPP